MLCRVNMLKLIDSTCMREKKSFAISHKRAAHAQKKKHLKLTCHGKASSGERTSDIIFSLFVVLMSAQ